ncbi:tail protein X [Lysobacter sp. CA196]|uniref:tail protein X n=1 Tax=Lysobacter sp. CA196 TaxID=3455606 RepID=UPI003F8D3000
MFLTHVTTEGERWDQLAYWYYGDPLQYERIIAANPNVAITATLPAGVPLSIPVVTQAPLQTELPPWMR